MPQGTTLLYSYIDESKIKAGYRTAVHLFVLAVSAVHLNHAGLVTIGIGKRGRSTDGLRPIGRKSLDVLRVEAMAEGMANDLVCHHSLVPGLGKSPQPVHPTGSFENRLHKPFEDLRSCPSKSHGMTDISGRGE